MKKILRLLSFLLFLILLHHSSAFAKDQLKVVYFHDFKPFSWKDKNGKVQGILIDVLNESLHNRIGIDITHNGYPWARAQLYVKNGEADAFVTVPTPERRTYTIISAEAAISRKATIFTNKGNPAINGLKAVKTVSDLKDFKQIQYIGNGWAKKTFKGVDVRWVPTLTDVLHRLTTGNYDYFASASKVVNYNIRELGYQDKLIEIPDVVLSTAAFHLCIRKHSSYIKLIPKFDKTIREMRRDGTLEKIYSKYK